MNLFSTAIRSSGLTITASLASIVFCANYALAQPAPDAYRVMVISDQAYGEMVLAGNYEDAIASLEARDRRVPRFAGRNNLCAAYIVTKDFALAKSSCAAAVKLSRGTARDRAIALTNRGVSHALLGDAASARKDFAAAIRIRARITQPVNNLARLESTSEPMASL